MKKLSLGLLAVSTIFTFACLAPADGDDAGTSRRDAGTTDTASGTDSGGGGGVDAGGGTWSASSYGQPCSTDAQCPGGVCASIFQEATNTFCYKSCQSESDCGDFPFPTTTVTCQAITQGATSGVCLGESAQNGPCGDPLNSACVQDYALCLQDSSSGVGLCARICKPDDPGTCFTTDFASVCGCQGSDVCTDAWTPGGDGICAPATSEGDTCGFDDQATGHYTPCTSGLECPGVGQSNPTSTCATPAVDGGVGEDI